MKCPFPSECMSKTGGDYANLLFDYVDRSVAGKRFENVTRF